MKHRTIETNLFCALSLFGRVSFLFKNINLINFLKESNRQKKILLSLPFFMVALTSSSCEQPEPKCVILLQRSNEGMFASLEDVMSLMNDYENKKVTCAIVDFRNTGLYYDKNKGLNWWQYYFEPIEIGDIDSNKTFEFRDNGRYYERNFSREKFYTFIKKYIHIKPELQGKIDQFFQEKLAGSYVIGVHYRGTDKSIEAPRVKYETVKKAIDEQILGLKEKHGSNYKIFVATDEDGFLAYMENVFGNKIYAQTIERSTDGNPVHSNPKNTPYESGEGALLDCILLSKSNILIRTSSNLSRWSTYFNPSIPVIELNVRWWW